MICNFSYLKTFVDPQKLVKQDHCETFRNIFHCTKFVTCNSIRGQLDR